MKPSDRIRQADFSIVDHGLPTGGVVDDVKDWVPIAQQAYQIANAPANQLFLVDNVLDYMLAHGQGPSCTWDILTDFPNLAPPFRNYFMEAAIPERVRLNERVSFFGLPVGSRRVGTQFCAVERGDALGWEEWEQFGIPDAARWAIQALVFYERASREVLGPMAIWHYFVGPRGEFFWPTKSLQKAPMAICQKAEQEKWDALAAIGLNPWQGLMFPGLLATSFLHCKNVATATS